MDAEIVLNLRRSGKGYNEICRLTGMTKNQVGYICRRSGAGGFVGGSHPLTEQQVSDIVSESGFDYIGGYEATKKPITVRCRQCSRIFERQFHIFRDVVNGTFGAQCCCPHCYKDQHSKMRERAERAKREAQMRAQHRAEQLSRKVSEQLTMRLANHVCKNCGTDFCIESTGYNSELYCSERCQRRWHERIKNEKRMDKLKTRPHDTDITLEKLFKRDDGVCYICGCHCDWSDIVEKDGTKIAGDHYPSIDHVKPVAKGGTHTWSNIKLACRACNTLKGWS